MTDHYITPTLAALIAKSSKQSSRPEPGHYEHPPAPVVAKPVKQCAYSKCAQPAKAKFCSVRCCNKHRYEGSAYINPKKGKE